MDDSAEVFYKYHGFLLSRMIKGEEGVQWTKSNLFEHLCEKFPVRSHYDDYKLLDLLCMLTSTTGDLRRDQGRKRSERGRKRTNPRRTN